MHDAFCRTGSSPTALATDTGDGPPPALGLSPWPTPLAAGAARAAHPPTALASATGGTLRVDPSSGTQQVQARATGRGAGSPAPLTRRITRIP